MLERWLSAAISYLAHLAEFLCVWDGASRTEPMEADTIKQRFW